MSRLTSMLRRNLTGATPLSLFFLTTVALAAWLGYQAVDAAASHRRTAEAVLRDYAGISATELARIARGDLDDVLDEVFNPVARRLRSGGATSPFLVRREMDDAARDQGCECPSLRSPIFVFRVDPPGALGIARTVDALPATIPEEALTRLATLIPLERPGAGRSRTGLFTVPAGSLIDEPTAVGYLLSQDDEGSPEPTFGFVVSTDAIAELFQEWYEQPLLPRQIAGDQPNDSLLYVQVEDPQGVQVFASPTQYPTTLGAVAPIGPEFGDLVVLAAIRPDAASQLIIGGLPRDRLPLLIALLLLTLGVGVAAFVQLRREQFFQRLREDFVSGVSHELRTPLAQIRMFSELQESGKLRSAEDRHRAVSVVSREARRLSHLVDNILQFSTLRRTGGHGMPRERIELRDAVAEGIDSVTPLLQDGGMRLEIASEDDLWVLANRDALTRVVVNLLDNAVKYGPPGQTVSVNLSRVNGAAHLSVGDEGPGVPHQDRDSIWKAYRRLDRDVRARIPGSGIGLSVVQRLASLHGGRAWVEEGDRGGARFVVELPLTTPEKEPREAGFVAEGVA